MFWNSVDKPSVVDELCLERTKRGRPPLGLKPKHIHDEERMMAIREAIKRYVEAKKQIPLEWVNEYNELVRSTDKHYHEIKE